MRNGWFRESYRHSLASKGIRTSMASARYNFVRGQGLSNLDKSELRETKKLVKNYFDRTPKTLEEAEKRREFLEDVKYDINRVQGDVEDLKEDLVRAEVGLLGAGLGLTTVAGHQISAMASQLPVVHPEWANQNPLTKSEASMFWDASQVSPDEARELIDKEWAAHYLSQGNTPLDPTAPSWMKYTSGPWGVGTLNNANPANNPVTASLLPLAAIPAVYVGTSVAEEALGGRGGVKQIASDEVEYLKHGNIDWDADDIEVGKMGDDI